MKMQSNVSIHQFIKIFAGLSERFPEMDWFVPVGLGDWMRSRVNNNMVHELNWFF